MPNELMLEILKRAEAWANRAGQTLARRHTMTPATFAVGRRPEERAMLAVACEIYDLLGATPEGCVLLAEMKLNPDAGVCALPTHDGLMAGAADHRARVAAGGSGGAV